MKIPSIFIPDRNLEGKTERLLKEEPVKAQRRYDKWELVSANTYAKGITKLKGQGHKPLTFSENIEVKIADYESNGKDAKLFDTWLDSVTGIAYKANSTKFKLILRSNELENINPYFNQRLYLLIIKLSRA